MNAKTKNNKEPVCTNNNKQAGPDLPHRKTLVIGLTGGVATGKSTVAGMLAELGARVLSADDVVHELMSPKSEVWKAIVTEFGKEILKPDGNIDRATLGRIVFNDPKKKARLEQIIHPPVLQYLAREVEEFRAKGAGVLVLEIPLLVETSSISLVDKVLVVNAEQERQIERLQYRYGINTSEAMARIRSQLPIADKLKIADFIISADDSLEETKDQVRRLWTSIKKLF